MDHDTRYHEDPAMSDTGARRTRQIMQELRAYWEGLRAGRLVPLRAEVDPRGIERALEYAFILDRIAPGIARFRLAGMHLNDLMGMEVRGMPISAMLVPASRDRMSEVLEQVFAGPAIATIDMAAETGLGRPTLGAKALLLPLRSDAGAVNRCLGVLISEGMPGRTPRRFALTDSHITALRAATALPGLAEPVAPFAARAPLSPEERRAQLRLVVSRDGT